MPSEETGSGGGGDKVVLPVLAQQWPGPLVGGFVTLSAPAAAAQRLEPAPVALPEAPGRLRNGAYAIQWWLFAGFTLVMTTRIIRDVGRDADAALGEAAEIEETTLSDPT